MSIPLLIAVALAGVYGLLTALGGSSQLKAKQIQPWAATLMIADGLLLIAAAILLVVQALLALYLLLIGLIIMHILAIHNGLEVHGQINLRHHLVRLFISVLIAFLAFWGMR